MELPPKLFYHSFKLCGHLFHKYFVNSLNIYRTFVSDEDISVYSVDETFLDVTDSLMYFKVDNAYDLARIIQTKVFPKLQ